MNYKLTLQPVGLEKEPPATQVAFINKAAISHGRINVCDGGYALHLVLMDGKDIPYFTGSYMECREKAQDLVSELNSIRN